MVDDYARKSADRSCIYGRVTLYAGVCVSSIHDVETCYPFFFGIGTSSRRRWARAFGSRISMRYTSEVCVSRPRCRAYHGEGG